MFLEHYGERRRQRPPQTVQSLPASKTASRSWEGERLGSCLDHPQSLAASCPGIGLTHSTRSHKQRLRNACFNPAALFSPRILAASLLTFSKDGPKCAGLTFWSVFTELDTFPRSTPTDQKSAGKGFATGSVSALAGKALCQLSKVANGVTR